MFAWWNKNYHKHEVSYLQKLKKQRWRKNTWKTYKCINSENGVSVKTVMPDIITQ